MATLPTRNYIPKFKQLKHQIDFAHNRDKFCAIVGGFGSGKSQADVFRALKLLAERDYAMVLLIAPTYSLLTDVNVPDFENIFQHYGIRYEHKKVERKLMVNSGNFTGEVWFRSADRPERIVGFDATDCIIDEYDIIKVEKQKELWRKVLGRLRGDENATLAVSTTPEGFRETYRLFEQDKIGPIIRAKTTDNKFLPPDYIQTLYDQYDEMLVRQYVNAEFVNVNGLAAYYSFDRVKHHHAPTAQQMAHAPYIGAGWDFNVSKMCVTLFIEHQDQILFFDELVIKGHSGRVSPTAKMCTLIRDRFPNREVRAFPDATGRARSTNAVMSDIAIIEQSGIKVYAGRSNPPVRDRLNAVNSGFYHGTVKVDTEKCVDLVADLEQVQRDKYGDIDKNDLERSHSSDAAGYAITRLKPIQRIIPQIKRAI